MTAQCGEDLGFCTLLFKHLFLRLFFVILRRESIYIIVMCPACNPLARLDEKCPWTPVTRQSLEESTKWFPGLSRPRPSLISLQHSRARSHRA